MMSEPYRVKERSVVGFRPSGFVAAFLGVCVVAGAAREGLADGPRRLSGGVNSGGGRSGAGGWTLSAACGFGAAPVRSAVMFGLETGPLCALSGEATGDLDGDGLPDDLDTDNDGDGVDDMAEISGAAYGFAAVSNPNHPDTDGDGSGDGDEALAGTNPADRHSVLRIVAMSWDRETRRARIVWDGRSDRTYDVLGLHDLRAGLEGAAWLGSVAPTGGMPPWYGVPAEWAATNDGATVWFYTIRLRLP